MAGPSRSSRTRDKSPSSTPVPSTESAQQTDGSQIPGAEWEAMSKVLNAIYDYRTADGFDPSKLFHRKVNKRVIPEYYETIKEPVAMSTIKAKIHQKSYNNFSEFVRDFALIPHNAQIFNIPESGAFQDALVIKEQVEKQLQLLVEADLITSAVATLPDLGEIPTYENIPADDTIAVAAEADGDEEEESDEEGEEDDDEDGEEDEDGRKKKRKGPRGGTSISKRDAADDMEGGKRSRGRPPKLLTPMEARMQTILKGIRKPRNKGSSLMIKHFDRLPDKTIMPDYYVEIKNPMAYDQLKRKVKRKKYKTLEDFMTDITLMFNNARQYNTDDSIIFKDAVALQAEATRLYDEERAKPDDEFADDEGKIPMPTGILHNGELYKVGDWIHIRNPNDLTKPIPAQVYRTYKAASGQNMVNVCWYYRPEQTIHRFDKHFFNNEVVKTGRYRDHPVEEVEGKCFIMFFTRYFKGRPRNLPEGTEIYVCQSRYNETAHQFNTIKTWASCLPDEVRDQDYEMDLFDHPRKMKKFPSPIAYLLKDEQKEIDELPKVTWGLDGAPPKIGAVHRKPRGEKDSPPPEPTPPPPPKMPTPPPRVPPTPQAYTPAPTQQPLRASTTSTAQTYQGFTPRVSHNQHYPSSNVPTPATQRPPSAQSMTYQQPATPQAAAPRPIPPPPSSSYQQPPGVPPNPAYAPRIPTAGSYRDPPPAEVYVLPDAANFSIPTEVRDQYQKDEYGRVLFFTVPPVAVKHEGTTRGHSVRYLAEKARRNEILSRKRKEREQENEAERQVAKQARVEHEQSIAVQIEEMKCQALDELEKQLASSVSQGLSDRNLAALIGAHQASQKRHEQQEENKRRRLAMRGIVLGSDFFADDWDSRLVQ